MFLGFGGGLREFSAYKDAWTLCIVVRGDSLWCEMKAPGEFWFHMRKLLLSFEQVYICTTIGG